MTAIRLVVDRTKKQGWNMTGEMILQSVALGACLGLLIFLVATAVLYYFN